jgi:hypothetical protein
MRTCFLSSQTNAIGGFSARLNGVRRGYPSQNEQPPNAGDAKARFEWNSLNDGR